MKRILFLFALLFTISLASEGQVMILKNKRHYKTYVIKEGDVLRYKLNENDAQWERGTIDSFDSTFLRINNARVYLKDIAAIEIQRKNLHYVQDGGMIMLAGVAYPTLVLLNSLFAWQKPHFTKTQRILFPAMILSGFGITRLQTKKCKIGKKYSLEVLIFNNPLLNK